MIKTSIEFVARTTPAGIPATAVNKTCDSAWKRIRRMIQAKGNTFELEMKKKVPKPPVVGSEQQQQPSVGGAEEGDRQV